MTILTVTQFLNEHGLLLSLRIHLNPVKPKDAVISDAIPSKAVLLLHNSGYSSGNSDQQPKTCSDIFISDINIIKDKCSYRYIRNVLKKNYVPCSTVFWSFNMETLSGRKYGQLQ